MLSNIINKVVGHTALKGIDVPKLVKESIQLKEKEYIKKCIENSIDYDKIIIQLYTEGSELKYAIKAVKSNELNHLISTHTFEYGSITDLIELCFNAED